MKGINIRRENKAAGGLGRAEPAEQYMAINCISTNHVLLDIVAKGDIYNGIRTIIGIIPSNERQSHKTGCSLCELLVHATRGVA
jgi:hypothetical protein